MQVNNASLDLIRRFEGWRSKAYKCSAGVLTIGYGHTSSAGAPRVKPGMTISKADGEEILRRDVENFAKGVRRLLKVDLNPNQFGALVSFAYNVGLGNFKKSSVLRVANARQFDRVPRRLALWNKAKGKVLKGLVRRRGDEGALFMTPVSAAVSDAEEPINDKSHIDEPVGKPMTQSTTNIAAIITALAGVTGTLSGSMKELGSAIGGQYGSVAAIAIMAAGAFWIIRERRKKSLDEGV